VKGIINLQLRLGPQQLSIHEHLMAAVSPISTHERILQAVDVSVDDPDIILFTCSSKQQYNARILMQSLPLVLEAKYGEDAILEAFTPAYWQSARSMFSKDEHGNYVSRQDHLQGKGTAALKALDTQDDGAMEIKIGSYEDVVVDRADIPAPDLISNMEFLFAAKLTPAGFCSGHQWPQPWNLLWGTPPKPSWEHLPLQGPLSWSSQPLPKPHSWNSLLSPRPLL
jgi:hypothetical protein